MLLIYSSTLSSALVQSNSEYQFDHKLVVIKMWVFIHLTVYIEQQALYGLDDHKSRLRSEKLLDHVWQPNLGEFLIDFLSSREKPCLVIVILWGLGPVKISIFYDFQNPPCKHKIWTFSFLRLYTLMAISQVIHSNIDVIPLTMQILRKESSKYFTKNVHCTKQQ